MGIPRISAEADTLRHIPGAASTSSAGAAAGQKEEIHPSSNGAIRPHTSELSLARCRAAYSPVHVSGGSSNYKRNLQTSQVPRTATKP